MRYPFRMFFYFLLLAALLTPSISQAAFNPNYILSDTELTDHTSMDLGSVFSFLKKRESALATYADPVTRISAAQIIYDAAQVFRLNPKFLLVLLQKEQSLIENGVAVSQDRLDWAAGYAICDSCTKDEPLIQKFKGFSNQVFYAAKRVREFMDKPGSFNFKAGQTHMIDGTPVLIMNDATSALIKYTPHLRGNELFYTLWNKWFSRLFLDGMILEDPETKSLYLIQNGHKRKFKTKSVFLTRNNLTDIVMASKNELDKYPEGTPIQFAENSLLRAPQGTVYLYSGDVRRGIVSKEVLRKIGFNPGEIVDVAWDDLNPIPEGPHITEKTIYPTGALVQNKKTGGVYFMKDGIRQPIVAREIMKVNFPNKKIIAMNEEDLASYQEGDKLRFRDGTLVGVADTPELYVISKGEKRLITSEEALKALGLKTDHVIETTQAVLDIHPTGEPIEALE